MLLLADEQHSQQEPRHHALGRTDEGRMLHITFTLRKVGSLIRVISARANERYRDKFSTAHRCQRHVSAHIASRSSCARQPSSSRASAGSA